MYWGKMTTPLVVLTAAIAALLTESTEGISGNTPDTPERLMATGKGYSSAEAKRARSLLDKLFVALSTKKTFAARIIEAGHREDKGALAQLIGNQIGVQTSQVTIDEVARDILVKVTIALPGGTKGTGCFDTEDSRCGGQSWSASISGK
jgi:hypothetical protein